MPAVSDGVCACIEEGQTDECQMGDCPWGEICYEGEPTWCGSPELIDWSVEITGYDIDCTDGVGGCEFLLYKERWDWDQEQWVLQDFTSVQKPPINDWLRVDVWEDDPFSNDYLNSFQVQIVNGVEAWKSGTPFHTSVGVDGTDSMQFSFAPL